MPRYNIHYVIISPEMEAKLATRHSVTAEEVRDACQAPNHYDRAKRHFDDRFGWRLLVYGRTRAGRRLKIILKAVDERDGSWRLRTAFDAPRSEGR